MKPSVSSVHSKHNESFYVLDAFDEYIVCYKNRSTVFLAGINNKAVTMGFSSQFLWLMDM
jgi:hypothetical protein